MQRPSLDATRRRHCGGSTLACVVLLSSMVTTTSVRGDSPTGGAISADEALSRIATLRGELGDESGSVGTADAWNELGWLEYRFEGNRTAALESAEKACALDPAHFKAHELAGRLEYLRGRNDRALTHWLTLLDDDRPEVELYLAATASLAVSLSEVEAVMMQLGEVERSHPNELLRTRVRRLLANHQLRQGNIDAAVELFAHIGNIEEWMIIGPFSSERNAGYGVSYGPEEEIDFDKEYAGRRGPVSWRPLVGVTLRRNVDLAAVCFPRRQVLGYALTFVHSPVARDATLRLGSSGATKVWFNDRLAYASDFERGFVTDQVTLPVRLEPGANKLLVKVCVETGVWKMAARLTNANGGPIAGVTFSRDIPTGGTPDHRTTDAPAFDYARSMLDEFRRRTEKTPENQDALYYLGLAQNAALFRTEASKTFARLAKLNDRCSDHFRLLARADLGDDKAEKALEAMKAGLKIDPGNARLSLMLARFYNQRNLREKEREVLRDIGDEYPDWRELDFQWANNFRSEGWEELAFRRIKKRHESEPTDLRALTSYTRMCAARGYADRVEELIKQIFALDFTNALARQERLQRAIIEERIDDVISEYELRHRLEPLNYGSRLARAQLVMQYERYHEAIRQCELSLAICADDDAIHRLLGTIHHRMGDDRAALSAFRTALRCRPEDRWLRAYVEYLEPDQDLVFERYAATSAEVEELLKREVSAVEYPKSAAVYILDEMVTQIFDDGSSSYRIHQIAKVLNETGREKWSRVALPGGASRVKRAVVMQPDGTEVEAARVTGSAIHFAQVQPGSIIEFIVIGYAPANDWISRHYNEQFFFQSNDPMIRSRFILLAPDSKPVNAWHQGEHVVYDTERFDGHTVHIWEARDVPRVQDEPNRPPFIDLCEQVRVSTISDWKEIARWEHSLIKDQFTADHELSAKARTLTEGLTDTKEKIEAVYNFVSRDIQYKIVRGGIFGYKPNKAANVLHNEWGDCKDKATLLITMLNELDIDARYATIRTRDVGKLIDAIPSNQCNHAIVYIPQADGLEHDLWVDGTALEHGARTLPWQDQGVTAMVWNGDGTMTFAETPVSPAEANSSGFVLDVSLAADGWATVKGRWRSTGQPSAGLRSAFKQVGQRAERLSQLLNRLAPGSVLKTYEFSDLTLRDAPVDIKLVFECSNYAVAAGSKLTLRPKGPYRATAQFAPREVRYYDVWLPYLQHQSFTENFTIPDGFVIRSVPESASLTSPWMDYTVTVASAVGTISVKRELVLKATEIPKDRYQAFRRLCIQIDDHEQQSVVIERESPPVRR